MTFFDDLEKLILDNTIVFEDKQDKQDKQEEEETKNIHGNNKIIIDKNIHYISSTNKLIPYNHMRLSDHLWFRCWKEKQIIMEDDKYMFKKTCDVKNCISHYYMRKKHISSICEIECEQYLDAVNKIIKNSRDETDEEYSKRQDSLDHTSLTESQSSALKRKCRIWQAYSNHRGYAYMTIWNRHRRVIRTMVELEEFRQVHANEYIKMSCNNKKCVQLSHIVVQAKEH